MIITVGHRKGGCGKTPLVVNIALKLALKGRDVVIVDADPQRSATTWVDDRLEFNPELKQVQCFARTGTSVYSAIQELGERYEYVIVDAAGRDSQELRLALAASDTCLIPITSDQTNINTLPYVSAIIKEATELNPKLLVRGFVNMADTNPQLKQEVADTHKAASAFSEIPILDTIIYFRKAWRDSMSEASGIMELKSKGGIQATSELNRLLTEAGIIESEIKELATVEVMA